MPADRGAGQGAEDRDAEFRVIRWHSEDFRAESEAEGEMLVHLVVDVGDPHPAALALWVEEQPGSVAGVAPDFAVSEHPTNGELPFGIAEIGLVEADIEFFDHLKGLSFFRRGAL